MNDLIETFKKLNTKSLDDNDLLSNNFAIIASILSPNKDNSTFGVMSILYTNLNKENALEKCEEISKLVENSSIVLNIVPLSSAFIINSFHDSKLKIKLKKEEKMELKKEEINEEKLKNSQLWWNLFRQEDILKNVIKINNEKIVEINKQIEKTKIELKESNFSSQEALNFFKQNPDIYDKKSIDFFENWINL